MVILGKLLLWIYFECLNQDKCQTTSLWNVLVEMHSDIISWTITNGIFIITTLTATQYLKTCILSKCRPIQWLVTLITHAWLYHQSTLQTSKIYIFWEYRTQCCTFSLKSMTIFISNICWKLFSKFKTYLQYPDITHKYSLVMMNINSWTFI